MLYLAFKFISTTSLSKIIGRTIYFLNLFILTFVQRYKQIFMDKTLMLNYIVTLRGYFLQVLKPNTAIECIGYSYSGGGLVKIILNTENKNSINIIEKDTQSDAFKELNLKKYLGNDKYDSFHFSGTNIIDDGNIIIFIKGDEKKEWTEAAAKNNILFLLKDEIHD